MAKFWGGGDCVDYKLQKINNVGAGEGFGYMVRLGLVRCSAGSCRCLSLLLKTHFWSAIATAPAETSAEAKEAFNIVYSSSLPLTPFNLEGAKLRFWNFACGPELPKEYDWNLKKKLQDYDVAAIAIWTVFPSFSMYTVPMQVIICHCV